MSYFQLISTKVHFKYSLHADFVIVILGMDKFLFVNVVEAVVLFNYSFEYYIYLVEF